MYELEVINGQVIATVGGLRLLCDSGAPTSQGHIPDEMAELVRPARPFGADLLSVDLAWIQRQVGIEFDGLLGGDYLSQFEVRFDWAEHRLRLDPHPSGEPSFGKAVPFQTMLNVPRIHATVHGRLVSAVVDTGASRTYASRSLTPRSSPEGRITDFYPGLGVFEAELFAGSIQIGGCASPLRIAQFPDSLSTLLGMFGVQAIIGLDWLNHERHASVSLNYLQGELVVHAPVPREQHV
jgi:hypothetical protein